MGRGLVGGLQGQLWSSSKPEQVFPYTFGNSGLETKTLKLLQSFLVWGRADLICVGSICNLLFILLSSIWWNFSFNQ